MKGEGSTMNSGELLNGRASITRPQKCRRTCKNVTQQCENAHTHALQKENNDASH